MDLLSNYDDETSNTSNRSVTEQVFSQKTEASGILQSEWEHFEKIIGSESLPETKDISCQKIEMQPSVEASQLLQAPSKENKQDDDDESHLPPGVRKKNRCHSSSSSSSSDDDNGNKSNSNSDMSCSDSDDSETAIRSNKDKMPNAEVENKEAKKKSESEEKTDKRIKKSVSRSRSRSPHSKRRRSSERSRHSKSRSRSRHRRKEKKHRSRRSRSHSRDRRRSKDRDYYRSKHRESKRKSRSRDRRDRRRDYRSRVSPDRNRRSRSRGDSERNRRSRSKEKSDYNRRSRSRSRERRKSTSPRGGKVIKYGDKVIKAGASFGRPPPSKPMTFKEKMRQQLIKAMEEGGDVAAALMSKDGTVICTQTAGTQLIPAPKKPPVPLMANIVTSTAGLTAATITASEAAMQSLIALQKETTEKTGVEIPKYYNPAAINPVKYAEQVQKRKLLWSKTKEKEVNSQWHATTLSSDHDDRSKEKFRKLMGIKQEGSAVEDEEELEQKQKDLFEKLDKEYQYARMATHTHRGVGLGFGSSTYPPQGT